MWQCQHSCVVAPGRRGRGRGGNWWGSWRLQQPRAGAGSKEPGTGGPGETAGTGGASGASGAGYLSGAAAAYGTQQGAGSAAAPGGGGAQAAAAATTNAENGTRAAQGWRPVISGYHHRDQNRDTRRGKNASGSACGRGFSAPGSDAMPLCDCKVVQTATCPESRPDQVALVLELSFSP